MAIKSSLPRLRDRSDTNIDVRHTTTDVVPVTIRPGKKYWNDNGIKSRILAVEVSGIAFARRAYLSISR